MARSDDFVRVRLACDPSVRDRALWVLEALLARVGVDEWQLVAAGEPADIGYGERGHAITVPHDPNAWSFRWDTEPTSDPLARCFWWLARVEEQLAPGDAFDHHGRFRYDSSALARGGAPFATPVDDVAVDLFGTLGTGPSWGPADDAPFAIVATHDIDQPWRWTRRGVRRTLRQLVLALRQGDLRGVGLSLLALATVPGSFVARRDPWCNGRAIARLEAEYGGQSTHYLLAAGDAPEDGDPAVQSRGRVRYAREVLAETNDADSLGTHGSYRTSEAVPEVLAAERASHLVELGARASVVRAELRDHRFHYLRHQPVDAWRLLDDAGMTSDATLGYAEQPGFRAGTCHPYRAWDHVHGAPLDVVIIPLAFMDASLDERYANVAPGPAAELILEVVVQAVARRRGCVSVLWHNDRLCTIDSRRWTNLYRWLLGRIVHSGGAVITAGHAARSYRRRAARRGGSAG